MRHRQDYLRPAWVEVNLKSIERNVAELKKAIGAGVRIMSVVKADGYGHGAVRSARAALKGGAERLAVALPEELAELRSAGIDAPIHILGDCPEAAIPLLIENQGIPSVFTYGFAKALNEALSGTKTKFPIHIKIDTGMSRLGVPHKQAVEFVKKIRTLDNLHIEGIFSHLATADKPDSAYTQTQIDRFAEILNNLENEGINIEIKHLANSAAALLVEESRFNMVRLGITCYGLHPCETTKKIIGLKPALSLRAKLSRVTEISEGDGVSYGIKFVADKPVKIGTVPLGYADGYTRLLSGKNYAIINGFLCRGAGNITMDQMMIEIPEGCNAKMGDLVILIGEQSGKTITADDLAETLGTINYEITCMMSKRLPRVYC